MANVDAAFGFVPIRHMSGNAPRTNKYTIASGLAENIFTGDLDALGRKTGQPIYQERKSTSSRGRDLAAMDD